MEQPKKKIIKVIRRVKKKVIVPDPTPKEETVYTPPPSPQPLVQPQLSVDTPQQEKRPYTPRTRRKITPESVHQDLKDLTIYLEEMLQEIRHIDSVRGNIRRIKNLKKRVKLIEKDAERLCTKKTPRTRINNSSGFDLKTDISDELAVFCGVPKGTKMSRAEFTKEYLQKHLVKNNLKSPKDGRIILPDNTLTKLLRYDSRPIEEGGHGPLYFWTIQKLMQIHFMRKTPAPNS